MQSANTHGGSSSNSNSSTGSGIHSSIGSDVSVKRKRGRNVVACMVCAYLKIKCDGGHPCSTCVKRNRVDLCSGKGNGDLSEEEVKKLLQEIDQQNNIVKLACSLCVKAKTKCDRERPCSRCVKRNTPMDCVDRSIKKRRKSHTKFSTSSSNSSSSSSLVTTPSPLHSRPSQKRIILPNPLMSKFFMDKNTPSHISFDIPSFLSNPDESILPEAMRYQLCNYHKTMNPNALRNFMLGGSHQWVFLLKHFCEYLSWDEVAELKNSMFQIAATVSSEKQLQKLQGTKMLFENYMPTGDETTMSLFEARSCEYSVVLTECEVGMISSQFTGFTENPQGYGVFKFSVLLARTEDNTLRINRQLEMNEAFKNMSGYTIDGFVSVANEFSKFKAQNPNSRKLPFILSLLDRSELLKHAPRLIRSWFVDQGGPKENVECTLLSNTLLLSKFKTQIPVHVLQITSSFPKSVLVVFQRR